MIWLRISIAAPSEPMLSSSVVARNNVSLYTSRNEYLLTAYLSGSIR